MKKLLYLTVSIIIVFGAIAIYIACREDIPPAVLNGIKENCHPIGLELLVGKVQEGQDLDSLVAMYEPQTMHHHDPYVTMTFEKGWDEEPIVEVPFNNITIVAFKGKLVRAGAFGRYWDYEFFNGMNEEEEEKYLFSQNTSPNPELKFKGFPLPFLPNGVSEMAVGVEIYLDGIYSESPMSILLRFLPYGKKHYHKFRTIPHMYESHIGLGGDDYSGPMKFHFGKQKPDRTGYILPVRIKRTPKDGKEVVIEKEIELINQEGVIELGEGFTLKYQFLNEDRGNSNGR